MRSIVKKSSSFNQLTMDRLLSDTNSIYYHKDGRPNKLGKFIYLTLNWLDNHYLPFLYDKKLVKLRYCSDPYSTEDWRLLPHKSKGSPTRAVGDLFWMNLPWLEYAKNLGSLNLVDLGCGDGDYFKKIQLFSQGLVNTYTGIDIFEKENWRKLSSLFDNIQFKVASMQDIKDHLPVDFNFIISQSALEHFPNDLILFKTLAKIIQSRGKKTIQIHLMPAPSCLQIYRYHGIRHYTPRSVGKLVSDYASFSKISLYALGGINCNNLHMSLVNNFFSKESPEYEKELFSAINNDIELGSIKDPSFWALVIESF